MIVGYSETMDVLQRNQKLKSDQYASNLKAAELESSKQSPEIDELVVHCEPRAMADLASRSAVAIATLLAIPDAIAILPESADPLSWFLRVVAIWLSALILWFLGYLALMFMVAWITGGVKLSNQGIELWRFGRLVPWRTVKAITVEKQAVFSHIFRLKPPAQRLTLYVQKRPQARMMPTSIPSFLFGVEQFDRLADTVSKAAFGFTPDSHEALIASAPDLPKLRKLYRLLGWSRIVVSVIIAIGLISFMGRRTAVNYYYNSGNQLFKCGDYTAAKRQYERAISFDPFFAPAWQNLGGTEFYLGHPSLARRCWLQALRIKPDLVEAKVDLSYMAMQERKFAEAREHLARALKLAPMDIAALINLADLDMRLGRVRSATTTARFILTRDPHNELATCLIAQGRLRMGNASGALQLLESRSAEHSRSSSTFCRLVIGETDMELGLDKAAENNLRSVLADSPSSPDALLDLARLKIRQQQLQPAEELLTRAKAAAPGDPRPLIMESDLALKANETARGEALLAGAMELPGQDAISLAKEAELSLKLGKDQQAIDLAKHSLAIEPMTVEAYTVLDQIEHRRSAGLP